MAIEETRLKKTGRGRPTKPNKGEPAIDRKGTWAALQAYVRDYNDKYDYDERDKRIRGGKLKTLECLYHDYMTDRSRGTSAPITMVETSLSLIARSTQQSARTIGRHIEFLKEAGLIKLTQRVNHWQNFMVCLDVDFIKSFKNTPETTVDKPKKSVRKYVNNGISKPP
jgi:DNA-binding transcriptional ArsR family regulator